MGEVVTLDQSIIISKRLREEGNIIILVGGCFDILHPGHLTFLERAKKQGDVLFVVLESDENVRNLKGKKRPVNDQQKRARALAAFDAVNYIIMLPQFSFDRDYFALTKKLSPNIIAITEGDPKQAEKQKQAKAVGAKLVVVTKYLKGYSTTNVLQNV